MARPRSRALIFALAVAPAAISPPGCGTAPPAPTSPAIAHSAKAPSEGAPVDSTALAPSRLRIHPLTRLSRELVPGTTSAWESQLACHIELKDKFGHSVKALGRLRVELYRPASAEPGGTLSEVQDLVWDVDLRDPDENALLYDDLVTRTYIVNLGGVPEWVIRWSSGDTREPWVTIKATYTAIDCQGHERRLEATYRLQK